MKHLRFFFRSRQFKIILAVTAALVAIALTAWAVGSSFSPQSSAVGAVTTSVQNGITKVYDWFNGIAKRIDSNNTALKENAELQKKVNELTSSLMDYQEAVNENEFYKKYLGIKDEHKDFIMEPATLISRNANDPYGSFVINKGSVHGISLYDPVITDAGVVGYITEVNPSFSKVTTVLDQSMRCAGKDRRTGDVGIITGELKSAQQGKTRINQLPRSSGVATDDYIVTSGGGVFPEGLVVGTVKSIHNESSGTSVYAVIDPAVNFSELRDVMVITYFSGQKAGE